MRKVFVTADLHLGHKKVIEFEREARHFPSIEEHDEEIILRWNETVNPTDTVWVLGDVVFGKGNMEKLARLNGVKKLVPGNHDMYATADYLKYFNRVQGAVEYRGCILTHIPVHPSQLDGRFRLNIHGHLHSDRVCCNCSGFRDFRYVCVSMEHTGLRPVLLDELIEGAQR